MVFCSCSSVSDVDINNVFRYNEHKNINSLDPIYAKDIANIWAVNQIFDGLVEMDSAMNITPSIAKKWSVSDDGKLYSFLIDTSVKFHPHHKIKNRNVTAHDFEYSFNRLIDPKIAAPGAWVLDKVESFIAVNDSIFEIKLKDPFNAFLGILTMKYCSSFNHQLDFCNPQRKLLNHAWEYVGEPKNAILHKEKLEYENIEVKERSYK